MIIFLKIFLQIQFKLELYKINKIIKFLIIKWKIKKDNLK